MLQSLFVLPKIIAMYNQAIKSVFHSTVIMWKLE